MMPGQLGPMMLLTDEHLDLPLTYEAMAEAGTMLGTGTPMVFDQTVSVVKAVTRWLEFYKHESCGKCTPCREGTYWITGVLEKFEHGQGQQAEMETLTDLCGQIAGRSFCALGSGCGLHRLIVFVADGAVGEETDSDFWHV